MLNAIKSIINRKQEFLESAQIIYEDAVNDIENYIIAEDVQPVVENAPLDNAPIDESKPVEDNDGDADDIGGVDELDIMSVDINDPDEVVPAAGANIFDMSLGDDNGNDVDDDSAIFSMTIDVKTNTLTDILPVPPLNAGDAMTDNIMSTKVEDGFTEAISIDAGADDTKPTEDAPEGDKPAEDTNPVTDAVIDKVNDAKATPVSGDGDDDAKAKLLDKLDKLNKGIVNMKEDIKKYIS